MYKDFEKRTLESVLDSGPVTAPTVFECITARTVELCGYEAVVLSGEGMSYCMNGLPDTGLLNAEEVIYLTTRLTNYTPLPVIVDAGAFYGDDPLEVYVDVSRLVKAGADAIVITDSLKTDGTNCKNAAATVDCEVFLSRIKAAVKACEGSKCLVVAKSVAEIPLAIERLNAAGKLGARIFCADKARTLDDAKTLASAIPGWKMWNGIDVENGACVVEPKDLVANGFCIIVEDYAVKASLFGMLYYGKKTLEDGNTVFHDTHTYDGILQPGEDYHVLFSFWKTWLPMEDEFNDLSAIMSKNHEIRS